MKRKLGLVLGVAVLFASARQVVKADIITSLQTVTATAGGYNFLYQVDLTNNEELGTSLGYSQFGTLYDVAPTVTTLSSITGYLATDFTFSQALANASAYQTTPVDSGALYNIRYTYNGTVDKTIVGGAVPTGTANVQLGTFTIFSTSNAYRVVSYDGEAGKSTGILVGSETGNVGSAAVPVGTPEPASMMLLGSGLFALGFFGRRKFSSKA